MVDGQYIELRSCFGVSTNKHNWGGTILWSKCDAKFRVNFMHSTNRVSFVFFQEGFSSGAPLCLFEYRLTGFD